MYDFAQIIINIYFYFLFSRTRNEPTMIKYSLIYCIRNSSYTRAMYKVHTHTHTQEKFTFLSPTIYLYIYLSSSVFLDLTLFLSVCLSQWGDTV